MLAFEISCYNALNFCFFPVVSRVLAEVTVVDFSQKWTNLLCFQPRWFVHVIKPAPG